MNSFFSKFREKKLCLFVRFLHSERILNGIKILFFGTDKFSLDSLRLLHRKRKEFGSLGIVTSYGSPSNAVFKFATKNNLTLYKWPISEKDCREFDLGVIVSFGHLIPKNIISSFSLGMINIHASILPRWRGAAPIFHAIINGDKTSGVSVIKVEPHHFDIGDVLGEREIEITSDMLFPDVHNKLAAEGAELLWRTISNIPQSLREGKQQNKDEITYAPRITASTNKIKWDEKRAIAVYNLYRALYSYKHLTTEFNNKIIKLLEISFPVGIDIRNEVAPGFIEFCKSKNCLRVYCKGGDCIEVHKIKVEGKKVMSARDFNNGFLSNHKSVDRYFK